MSEDSVRVTPFAMNDADFVLISYRLDGAEWADKLAPGELDVARQIVRGRSNADIAKMRGASVHTVTNQISVIFSKLGVTTRGELIASHSVCVDDRGRASSGRPEPPP
jgi:DNA-binding CsgD family transcriptional regulator